MTNPEAPFFTAPLPLSEGETLLATFTPDPAAYWRGQGGLALIAGAIAGAVLVYLGDAHPWVGPVAAVLAVGARAAYVKSEAMTEEWRLTNLRLLGPAGRAANLSSLTQVRPFFDAVQLVTKSDKHLIKYLADPAAAVATIKAVMP